MSRHADRVKEVIIHEAANFIVREATPQSLITVTRAVLSVHGDECTVFVTVFPQEAVGPALSFLARSTHDFRTHLAKHAKIHPLPKIIFALDEGELNRQRLDELGRQT